MKSSNYCLLLLFFCIFVSNISCKKNEAPASPMPVTYKAIYKSYEVAAIHYRNTLDVNQSLPGTVGGKEVKIAVINDSILSIVVMPDVFVNGSNTLEFTDKNKILKVIIDHQVSAGVADPQQTFVEHKAGLQAQVDFYEGLKATDTLGLFDDQGMKDVLSAAKASIATMQEGWGEMTDPQKIVVANILAANAPEKKEIITRLNDMAASIFYNRSGLLKTTREEFCPQDQYQKQSDRYKCFGENFGRETVKFTKNTMYTIGGSLTALFGIDKTSYYKVAFGEASTAAVNIYYISKEIANWRSKVVKASIFGVEGAANKTTGVTTFRKDQDNSMPVSITARRLQASDASTGPEWISSILGSINGFNAFCDQYSLFLSTFKIVLADPSPAEKSISAISDLSITDISNSKVQFVSIGGTPASPTIKFTTPEASNQNFSFNVKYNDGVNNPITVKIEAELIQQSSFCIGFTSPAQLGIILNGLYGRDTYFWVNTITTGEDYIYHCRRSTGYNYIEVYDNHATSLKQFATPVQYMSVEIKFCNGYLWLIGFNGNNNDNVLLKIDPSNGNVLLTIPFKSYNENSSHYSFLARSGNRLFLQTIQTENGPGSIAEVNTADGTIGAGTSFDRNGKYYFEDHNGFVYSHTGTTGMRKYNLITKQYSTITFSSPGGGGWLKEFCGKLYVFISPDPVNPSDDYFIEITE